MLPSDKQPVETQCAFEANGERCRYPGTMSTTTLGEGPYFCRWHFQCESAVMGMAIIEDSRRYRPLDIRGYRHQDADRAAAASLAASQAGAEAYCAKHKLTTVPQMREHIRHLIETVGRRAPSTDWAFAILERMERGEAVPISAERMARKAADQVTHVQKRLALPAPQREPGEDVAESV